MVAAEAAAASAALLAALLAWHAAGPTQPNGQPHGQPNGQGTAVAPSGGGSALGGVPLSALAQAMLDTARW